MEAVSTETFKKKAVGPLKQFNYDGTANLREFFDANLITYYENLQLDDDGIPKADALVDYELLPEELARTWYKATVARQKGSKAKAIGGAGH
jgi:hypothetical protein